jgi:hypothetical protein
MYGGNVIGELRERKSKKKRNRKWEWEWLCERDDQTLRGCLCYAEEETQPHAILYRCISLRCLENSIAHESHVATLK